MKFLLSCLILIVLGASTAPCCPPLLAERDYDHNEVSFCDVEADHCCDKKDENEKGCKSCSPFFTCGNCSGFIVSKFTTSLDHIFLEPVSILPEQKIVFPEDYFSAKWQPPKIA